MTQEIVNLQEKINSLKNGAKTPPKTIHTNGYAVGAVILTDLLSCVFVGLAIGLFFQKFFHTSALWTAGLTLLGGIAGLWTVSRFALSRNKGIDS